MPKNKEFEDWFYEQQGFAQRAEWFYDDMDKMIGSSAIDNIRVMRWLRAAYDAGKEHALEPLQDDGK